MSSRLRAPAVIILAGVFGCACVALILNVPAGHLLLVLAVAGGATLAVALAGVGLRALVSRRSSTIGAQSALAAVLTASATLAAFAMVSLTMLVSQHDLAIVLAVLPLAAGAGIAYGISSGWRVTADLLALAAAIRKIEPGTEPRWPSAAGTAEVATVADGLRTATAKLAEATERQQTLEAGRRELVAWASHDLRTPLAGLRAVAEALADDVAPDEAARQRYLVGLTTHVDQLTALVDDLFELAQIESGGLTMEMEPTQISALVAEVAESFRSRAESAGVNLEVIAAPGGTSVLAGRDHLGRVLANLLDNAVRHTPPDGRIQVRVEDQHGGVSVAVQDGCGGIPEDDLPLLFTRLWRGGPGGRRWGRPRAGHRQGPR